MLVNLFLKYGAGNAFWIPIDLYRKENNDNETVLEMISKSTGFFFGGGIMWQFFQIEFQD